MENLSKLMTALGIPLNLLNALGGIVSVIWLLVGGDWRTIVAGVVILLFSSFLVRILMLPGLAITAVTVAIGAKKDMKGMAFFTAAFLGNLYFIAVITVWCLVILVVFLFLGDKAHASSPLPYLLGSYAIALSPLQRMAALENGPGMQGLGTIIIVFFAQVAQVAYVVTMLMMWLGSPSLANVGVAFSAVMVVAWVIQSRLALLAQREGF